METKARFEGELILRYLHKPVKGKWFEVISPFRYIDREGTWWNVPDGTKTDFASIPKGFLWLIDSVGKYGRAAVLHDWMCESKIVKRKEADRLFLEAMEVLGVGWLKRRMMYMGVRAYSIATIKR